MKRIICIGNRFVGGDDTGPRVFDFLSAESLPSEVELIDGGIAGLNLLNLVEKSTKVVFVDSLSGFASPGEIVVLDAEEAAENVGASFEHSGGLAYLLKALPVAVEGAMPEVVVAGVEGIADDSTIKKLAETCVSLVSR